MNETVTLQRHARQLHRDGKYEEAAAAYRAAADSCSGFPHKINLKCAEDCDNRRPFEGHTPSEATY